MSTLDKLDHLLAQGDRFEKELDADCDRLLARYDEVQQKKQKIFDRRHTALSERAAKIDLIDEALDRLSNMGNSTDSSGG